jgi:murein DD-endopeptidase MepM/ murein hydrolase activator NlpD
MYFRKNKKALFFIFLLILSLNIFGYDYIVKSGDNLSKISENTGISIQVILENNKFLLNQKYLQIGQKIVIPEDNSLEYTVKYGDNIYNISRSYFIKPEVIIEANNLKNPNQIFYGQILKIPYEEIGSCFNISSNWPIIGYVTSNYGYRIHPIYKVRKFHHGIDIAAPIGTPIFSTANGIVEEINEDSGYGKHVIIKSNDKKYIYAHMSDFNVVPGMVVQKGDLIGKVGNTGLSTGPHLHYQINNQYNSSIDPLNYLGDMRYAYIYKEDNLAMGGE